MTPNTGQSVTHDREMIESNVRRIVGIAALRRVHKLLTDRRDEERILRAVVAPIAAFMMIVIAALIWTYGSPRAESQLAPLPECSPPRSQNITI
jgi:hypothetical protein